MKSSSSAGSFVAQPILGGDRSFQPSSTVRPSTAARDDVPLSEAPPEDLFEQGRQAGRAELPWQEAEELCQAASALDEALHHVEAQGRARVRAERDTVIHLALAIAERLIGHAVEVDLGALETRVEAALELVKGPDPIQIRLCSADHELVLGGGAPELVRLAEAHGAIFLADDTIRRGSARLNAGERQVSLDPGPALDRLARDLRTWLDAGASVEDETGSLETQDAPGAES